MLQGGPGERPIMLQGGMALASGAARTRQDRSQLLAMWPLLVVLQPPQLLLLAVLPSGTLPAIKASRLTPAAPR